MQILLEKEAATYYEVLNLRFDLLKTFQDTYFWGIIICYLGDYLQQTYYNTFNET